MPSSAPLTAAVSSDPQILEKAINRRRLAELIANTGGTGAGSSARRPANSQSEVSSTEDPQLIESSEQSFQPGEPSTENPPAPTSILGNVLKGVSGVNPPLQSGSDGVASLLSFDQEPPLPVAQQLAQASEYQSLYGEQSSPPPAVEQQDSRYSISAQTDPTLSTATEVTIEPQQISASESSDPTQASDAGVTNPLTLASSNGPVFSGRVPIPFLPRPSSSFLQTLHTAADTSEISVPQAEDASYEAPSTSVSHVTAETDLFFSEPVSLDPLTSPTGTASLGLEPTVNPVSSTASLTSNEFFSGLGTFSPASDKPQVPYSEPAAVHDSATQAAALRAPYSQELSAQAHTPQAAALQAPYSQQAPGQTAASAQSTPHPQAASAQSQLGDQSLLDLFDDQVISRPTGATVQQSEQQSAQSFAPVAGRVASGLDFFSESLPPGATFTSSQPETVQTSPPFDKEQPQPQTAPSPNTPTSGLDFFSVSPPTPPPTLVMESNPANIGGAPAGMQLPDQAMSQQAASTDFFARAGQNRTQEAASGGATSLPSAPSASDEQDFPDESFKRGHGRSGAAQSSSLSKSGSARDSSSAGSAGGTPVEKVLDFVKDLNGECSVLGKTMPKKNVLLCGLVAAFICFQVLSLLFGMVTTGIGGAINVGRPQNINQSVAQYPSLAGSWELVFKGDNEQTQHEGQMQLAQRGANLQGQGQDQAPFTIQGTFSPPRIMFSKQYVVEGQAKGKPISWQGTVQFGAGQPPFMQGVFVAFIKRGIFTSLRMEEVHGKWQAQMLQPEPTSGPGTPIVSDQPMPEPPLPKAGFQDVVNRILLGMLVVGVIVVFGSLKLFGPAGLINIWAKQEYIPSQFKSQHRKMLGELGRPLKPGGLPLGEREDWNILKMGEPKELHLPPDIRDQNPHLLLLGSGAKGKTRLMANMATNDIISGDRAVAVIDSDGHLVELILRWLGSHPKAAELAKRVVVIDPTNKEGCAAYNPLEPPEDGDFQSAASSVVYGFKAIYTEPPGSQSQWNQQTANILRNSALLLMANNKTLTDLPVLLGDNDFRDVLLEKVEKRKGERVEFITLLDQWTQYKRLARTDQWINWVEPILNRVSPMLSDPRIRPILTKSDGDLSLRQVILDHKILLVKIPQGQLDQNASLLGSLIVTGLKQAALSIATATSKRHFTALYLDEFDNFIERDTFDALTSETRKFQVGFTATIKTLQHLPEDFRNQIIINVGTICAFSLAKKDADLLGPQMFRVDGRKVKHQTIQNIFNKVNTSPQFELISDEEKLNIDRLVGQEERTYYCYRVGTIAGVFHMKAYEFKDVSDTEINWSLIDQIYGNKRVEVERL